MTIIEDGRSSKTVEVNDKNQLRIRATQHPEEHFVSHAEGQSYLAGTGQVAGVPTLTLLTTEGGDILYLENTGTVTMVVTQFGITADAPGIIYTLYKNRIKGTLTQNTPITSVNLNFGSANVATAQAEVWDESNGDGILGLTNGDIIATGITGGTTFIQTGSAVLIPQGKSITLNLDNPTAGTIEVSIAIRFYFDTEI